MIAWIAFGQNFPFDKTHFVWTQKSKELRHDIEQVKGKLNR